MLFQQQNVLFACAVFIIIYDVQVKGEQGWTRGAVTALSFASLFLLFYGGSFLVVSHRLSKLREKEDWEQLPSNEELTRQQLLRLLLTKEDATPGPNHGSQNSYHINFPDGGREAFDPDERVPRPEVSYSPLPRPSGIPPVDISGMGGAWPMSRSVSSPSTISSPSATEQALSREARRMEIEMGGRPQASHTLLGAPSTSSAPPLSPRIERVETHDWANPAIDPHGPE
ncbi:MAG: hypothetical protein M1837_005372 [Sclerophora amabilis]|nr:MAG: hypothetical protein M1837_005372 [Sclerophora amabilis]